MHLMAYGLFSLGDVILSRGTLLIPAESPDMDLKGENQLAAVFMLINRAASKKKTPVFSQRKNGQRRVVNRSKNPHY